MNDSSSCYLFPPGTICSSNGVCTNGKCICTVEGFSTIGDLRFQIGLDCDVYLPAIIGLWIAVFCFSILTVISSSCQLLNQIRKHGYEIVMNKPITQVHVGLTIVCGNWSIAAIWRLSNIEGTATGIDLSMTYFQVYCGLALSIFAMFLLYRFYTVHSNIIKGGQQKKKKFEILLFVLFLITIPLWVSMLWGLYQPLDVESVLMFRYIFDAISNCSYAILSPVAFNSLIKELDSSIKSGLSKTKPQFIQIQKNLKIVRRELMIEPFILGVIKLAFAFWPFLRQKVVYEYVIQVMLWMIMTLAVSLLIMTKNLSNSVVNITITASEGDEPKPRSPSKDFSLSTIKQ